MELAAVLSSGAPARPEVATPAVSLSRLEEVFTGEALSHGCVVREVIGHLRYEQGALLGQLFLLSL